MYVLHYDNDKEELTFAKRWQADNAALNLAGQGYAVLLTKRFPNRRRYRELGRFAREGRNILFQSYSGLLAEVRRNEPRAYISYFEE